MISFKQDFNRGVILMKTSLIGYPRIGAFRELKFAVEKYFAGALSEDGL